jgi:hypothetical protein
MLHFSPSLIALSMNGMYNAAQIGQYNSPNGGEEDVWVQRSYNREIIEVKML